MNKVNRPGRLVVLRTTALEELLQEVWRLRPDIRDKISLTVSTAFFALIKESTPEKATSTAKPLSHEAVTALLEEAEASSRGSVNSAASEPHPDGIWNL